MSDKITSHFIKENSFQDNWLVDGHNNNNNNYNSKINDLGQELEGLNLGFDNYLYKGMTPKTSDSRLNELKDFIPDDLFDRIEHGSPIKSKRGKNSSKLIADYFLSDNIDHNNSFNDENLNSNNFKKRVNHSLFFNSDKENNMNSVNSMGQNLGNSNYYSKELINYPENNNTHSFKNDHYNNKLEFDNNFASANEERRSLNTFDNYRNFNEELASNNNNNSLKSDIKKKVPLTKLGNYDNVTYIPKSYINRVQNNNTLNTINNKNSNVGNNYANLNQLNYSKQMTGGITNNSILNNTNNFNQFNQQNINNVNKNLMAANNITSNNFSNASQDNKSFMYGKIGWVCSMCKNFNYEKRVKCNRCGKAQMTPIAENIKKININNNNSMNFLNDNMRKQEEYLKNQSPQLELSMNYYSPLLSQTTMNESPSSNYNNNLISPNQDYSVTPSLFNNVNNNNQFSSENNQFNTNPLLFKQLQMQQIKNNNNNNITNNNKFKQVLDNNNSIQQNLDSLKKQKKPFVERPGDWVCIKCKNLNFSFRAVCNRCQLTKGDSDKLFDQYMKNLMSYVKINEVYQTQVNKDMNNIDLTAFNNNFNFNNDNLQCEEDEFMFDNQGESNNNNNNNNIYNKNQTLQEYANLYLKSSCINESELNEKKEEEDMFKGRKEDDEQKAFYENEFSG